MTSNTTSANTKPMAATKQAAAATVAIFVDLGVEFLLSRAAVVSATNRVSPHDPHPVDSCQHSR